MAIKKIKDANEGWQDKELTVTCPYCGAMYKGKITDFTIVTDNPKQYNFEMTCQECNNKIKF